MTTAMIVIRLVTLLITRLVVLLDLEVTCCYSKALVVGEKEIVITAIATLVVGEKEIIITTIATLVGCLTDTSYSDRSCHCSARCNSKLPN